MPAVPMGTTAAPRAVTRCGPPRVNVGGAMMPATAILTSLSRFVRSMAVGRKRLLSREGGTKWRANRVSCRPPVNPPNGWPPATKRFSGEDMTTPISRDDPYIGWRPRLADPVLRRQDTALLVIDMQYADAPKDYGIFKHRRDHGYTNGLDYMERRLELIVPNIQRLQAACRTRGIEVVFTRIRSLTADGRDRSLAHKELGHMFPPGSREAE